MKFLTSLLLLLSALSLWACSDYESTHKMAPIPIDRAIRTYYSAREVRIKTQNTQSFPLIYEISNSLYCDNPFYSSEDLSGECKEFVVVANSYGEKGAPKVTYDFYKVPTTIVTNVSRLQLLAVAAPKDTVDVSSQARLSFPTAQDFIASNYQNRVVTTVEGSFKELTREQLRWLPESQVTRCTLPHIRNKELWLKTTFTDGHQSLTKVELPR